MIQDFSMLGTYPKEKWELPEYPSADDWIREL